MPILGCVRLTEHLLVVTDDMFRLRLWPAGKLLDLSSASSGYPRDDLAIRGYNWGYEPKHRMNPMTTDDLMTGPTQAELAQAHADWSKRRARQANLLRELEASTHPNDHHAALHLRAMIRADAAVAAMLATHL